MGEKEEKRGGGGEEGKEGGRRGEGEGGGLGVNCCKGYGFA